MANHDGKVVISTKLDNSGIPGGIKELTGKLGGLKTVLGKLGGAITAAFSVVAITRFAAECIELGSSLEEVQNVVDVSFGDMSDRMEEFAQNAITQFGMSELAAKQTGSTYMAMAKGLGVAQTAAADMSLALTGLSGDVASFFNMDQETAAKKLQGIFTGESEALKELGVVMTQTNLKQFALANGMNANIEAMSQAEQVALRYAFVTDALSLASGDFARTQNSWANQTRILSMLWQQFMSEIGSSLTTVLLPVVKVLNTIVSALISVAKAIRTVISALFGTSSSVAQQNNAVAESASAGAAAESDLADATTAAGKAAKKAIAGFDELNKLQSQSGGGGTVGDISAGGGFSVDTTVDGDIEDNLSPKIQAVIDKIQQLIAPLKEIDFSPAIAAFERLKAAVEPITSKLFEGLEWAWFNILVPLAEWTIEDALPVFLDLLSAALGLLDTVIEGLKPLGIWLWEKFLQPMAKWTGDAIVKGLNGLSDALSGISDWIDENQEGINNFVIVLGSIAGAFGIATVLSGIGTAIKEIQLASAGMKIVMSPNVAGTIMAWVARIGMSISNIGAWITGTLVPAVSSALGGIATALGISVGWVVAIVAAVGAAVAAIIIYWDEICAFFAVAAEWFNVNVIQPIAQFFSGLWTGISTAASNCWAAIVEFFTPAIEWFSALFGSVWQTISDIFYNIGVIASGCWEVIKAVWGVVSGWFNENIIQPVSSFFSEMWDGFIEKAKNAWKRFWVSRSEIRSLGRRCSATIPGWRSCEVMYEKL